VNPPESSEKITLPAGTRLALVLQTGINTRTAKPGDSVYFQTVYPVAQGNRMVIPVGSFARGEVTSVKRPGRVKGRAELCMRITSITFPNGYVVSLVAIPGSLDNNGKEGVSTEGKIKGQSGAVKDAEVIGLTTVGGFVVGTQAGLVAGIANNSARAVGVGSAAGAGGGLLAGLLIMVLTRGPEVELHRGTTLDAVFDRPLVLDAALLPTGNLANVPVALPPPASAVEKPAERRHRGPLWPVLPQ
jgi:type IV secretion system protein VirB10